MTITYDEAVLRSVRHYLGQIAAVLDRLSSHEAPADLLAIRLAPDMFDTGFNFALASQFAARALCPPAGVEPPEIPEDLSCDGLRAFNAEIGTLIAPVTADQLRGRVRHSAGNAQLEQDAPDYIARFALPNMIFHLSVAYAGLRHGGMAIGKADFDGLHVY